MSAVAVPEAIGAEDAAWQLLLDLAAADLPRWAVVGGLMVHLHQHEHGAIPRRATTDIDVLVNIEVAAERATERFARILTSQFGMRMEVATDQRGHRFVRDDAAAVDVLAPDRYRRAEPPRTIPPARTVTTPGGRYLLSRIEEVTITYRGRTEQLLRPRLLAAIVGKWRAFEAITNQRDPERHLRDAADMASLIDDPDAMDRDNGERRHLRAMYARLTDRTDLIGAGADADHVLDTLNLLAHE